MNIPTFVAANRPPEDIYGEIVALDQRYDRNDWRYKLEGNCIGRLILTLFSCCFCFVPDDRRDGWKERARWLHSNQPAPDSPHYTLWRQAWNRVERNRVRVYAPVYSSDIMLEHSRSRPSFVQPHYVQSVRPTVNMQPNFVPHTVVQQRPVVQPHYVQPVARPTINTQPYFVPQAVPSRPVPTIVPPVNVASPAYNRPVAANTRPINGPMPGRPPLTMVNAARVSPQQRPFYQQQGNLFNPNNLPMVPAAPAPMNNRPMSFDPSQFAK